MEQEKKALYFTASKVPTADELAEAQALGISAMRNGSKVRTVERGVAKVAGKVPECYRNAKGVQIVGVAKVEAGKQDAPAEAPKGKAGK